jgi:hypothetical protein
MANDSKDTNGANSPRARRRPAAANGASAKARGAVRAKTAKAGAAGEAAPATVKRVKAATPWGAAAVVEQVTLEQEAAGRAFASIVQLLETDEGERLVRFAYTTSGTARRGPVTLRPRDVHRLRAALGEHPALAEALGLGGGEA